MASNKKAQILAAVMCASSIFGSYTMVSAANTIELDNIVSSDKTSSVSAGTNTITATAGASKEQQSTISLKNGSLSISVGKQYGQKVYDGTFTLNSKNLSIASTGLTLNNNSLYVKNNNGETVGSITNSGAITGTGLTIKGTSSSSISSDNNGRSANSTVSYSRGVVDTVTNTTNKTTSTVAATGVTDIVYQADGKTKIAESKVATNGITDTFTDSNKSVIYSVTTNGSGTTFKSTASGAGTTVINGGTITASKDVKIGKTSLKAIADTVNNFGSDSGVSLVNLAGIKRDSGVTTIEGATSFNKDGMFLSKDEGKDLEGNKLTTETTVKAGYIGIKNQSGYTTFSVDHSGAINAANGEFTVDAKGNTTTKTVNGVTIGTYTEAVRSSGDLKGGDILIGTPDAETDADKINLSAIDRNTAGIVKDENGTTIEGTTTFDSNGVTVGDLAKDGSSTGISAGQATFNKTDANGNYTYTQVDGGTITASEDIGLTDGTSLKDLSTNVGEINKNTEGISRDEETTTIEGVASFNKDGMTVNTGNSFVNVGTDNIVLNNSGNGIVIDKDGTSIIGAQGKHSINITRTGTEFLNGQDGTSTVISGGDITTDTITTDTIKIGDKTIDDDFFGTTGDTNTNTAGIERDGNDITGYTTSIETTFRIHSPGVSHNVGTIDIYGDTIQATTANGQNTIITGNRITTNELTVGGIKFGDLVNRVEDLEDKTQNITPSNPGTGEGGSVVPPTTGGQTGINGDVTVGGDLSVGGNLTADSATIGGVTMKDNTVTATTGNFDNIAVGGENGTTINKDGITVGKAEEGQSYTSITKDDVKVTDSQGNTTSLTDVGNRVTGLESSMNNMNNRLNDVEDRIDKVGAMAAAIANLRTMGFDPEAPTEIAIGVGQYKSETGLALGVFHYPNQDFMLSASISTSGDEVMGGIGATWKLGRKSAAEKALDAKDEEAKHLEKAEEMKKLAQDAKVKAQAERHAKLLAEREAQKTA